MSKHGKLVNVLMKLHFIEDSQRSVKEIRGRIEHYEKRNPEQVSKWPHDGMSEHMQKEISDLHTSAKNAVKQGQIDLANQQQQY